MNDQKGGDSIFNINIPEHIYDSEISRNELLAYAYINKKCSLYKDDVYVACDELAYYIQVNKRTAKNILDALVDKGLIVYNEEVVAHNSVLKTDGEKFVQLPYESLFKIESANLLLYFCKLMSTRDMSTRVGFQKLEYIAELYNISERTAIRYNEELEKLGVIYIRRSSIPIRRDDGSVYYKNNLYGLVEDKDAIDKYANDNNYGTEKTEHGANWQRMVTAKYNAYCKAPNSYSGDVDELMSMCEEYNALMDELQKRQAGSDYIKKKKNLDVFLF